MCCLVDVVHPLDLLSRVMGQGLIKASDVVKDAKRGKKTTCEEFMAVMGNYGVPRSLSNGTPELEISIPVITKTVKKTGEGKSWEVQEKEQ